MLSKSQTLDESDKKNECDIGNIEGKRVSRDSEEKRQEQEGRLEQGRQETLTKQDKTTQTDLIQESVIIEEESIQEAGGHSLTHKMFAKDENLFILKERDEVLASVSRINEKRACITTSELIEKTKIMPSDLELNYEIGRGSYGIVHGGLLKRADKDYKTCVAVKRVKGKYDRDSLEALFVELKMLYFLRLMKIKNVQYLYGAVYENGKPVSIVSFFIGKNNESTTLNRVLGQDRKFEMQFANFLHFCCSLAAGLLVHCLSFMF
eukprot:Seg1139.3 transcript_id=Seg1139.3/GoldUCD/mRNA.D3Y31 product="hypothetical protein" protein_id=Seg1139.3/GoldUCD/D3Y31